MNNLLTELEREKRKLDRQVQKTNINTHTVNYYQSHDVADNNEKQLSKLKAASLRFNEFKL